MSIGIGSGYGIQRIFHATFPFTSKPLNSFVDRGQLLEHEFSPLSASPCLSLGSSINYARIKYLLNLFSPPPATPIPTGSFNIFSVNERARHQWDAN